MGLPRKLNEACAVFGVSLTTDDAVGIVYNGLLALQHRGQEGAGIAVVSGNKILCHKDAGLVSEVFPGRNLGNLLRGRLSVGHTRYSTTGGSRRENVGPFVTEFLTGRVATAHNGNILNAQEIRHNLNSKGIAFNATCDSEIISSLIAYEITQERDTVKGIIAAAKPLRGAFSLAIASGDNKLVAVRDPNGFRPLCIGRHEIGYAVASESCALEVCGFEVVRDVRPGEVVVFEDGEIVSEEIALDEKSSDLGLCIFEYVYFARPDSVIDGLSVYEARRNMGRELADEHPVDADVVCGVPDSGLDAATGYSEVSGIKLAVGLVKNRYIGRSFIYPTQSQRDSAVRQKFNPLSPTIRGKNVVLVDDSIVRGTTCEKLVRTLKAAGAKSVHMRVSSPPFRHTCHFGTDIDSEDNLIANKISQMELCRKIGADSLGYIEMSRLERACKDCRLSFCTACFTGKGITTHVRKDVLEDSL
jgi:amidophosphoribosyltransferase